jgi:hypothetical protein
MEVSIWDTHGCSRFDMDESCFEIGMTSYSNIRSREDDTSKRTSHCYTLKRSWNVEGCSRTYKVIHGKNSSTHCKISSFRKNDLISMGIEVEKYFGRWIRKSGWSVEYKVAIYSRGIKGMRTSGFHDKICSYQRS